MHLIALLRRLAIEPIPLSGREKWLSTLACVMAMLLTSTLTHQFAPDAPLLIASMGASAVILFVIHGSPMAQPWPFFGSHVFSGLAGVYSAYHVPDPAWALACAMSASIASMLLLRCLHPPGAATALVPVLSHDTVTSPDFHFLIVPLGLNVSALLVLALIINRLILRRAYPSGLRDPKPQASQADYSPLLDIGIDDIASASRDLTHFLDVSTHDLLQIFSRLQALYAQRHLGMLNCGDLMQRDVITVEYATEVETAWRLMHQQKLTVLPVLDRHRHVIGIVTRHDFLKNMAWVPHERFQAQWLNFIKRTPAPQTHKPEAIGHIMTRKVKTLPADAPFAALIPLVVDEGHHHIPIVDAERQFVGVVFQRRVVATLFNQHALAQAPESQGESS